MRHIVEKLRKGETELPAGAQVVYGLPPREFEDEVYVVTGAGNDTAVAELGRLLTAQKQRADALEARVHELAREKQETERKNRHLQNKISRYRARSDTARLRLADAKSNINQAVNELFRATEDD